MELCLWLFLSSSVDMLEYQPTVRISDAVHVLDYDRANFEVY